MKSTLIVYDTASGSTGEMAAILHDEMKNTAVRVSRVDDVKSIDDYDVIIIGSPIRFGGFTNRIKKFVKNHWNELATKKIMVYFSCLYIVSFREEQYPPVPLYIDPTLNMQTISRKGATSMDKTHSVSGYYKAVTRQTAGIVPAAAAYFNGRLDLARLNVFLRLFMKIVVAFTDKERVGEFMNRDSVREGAAFFSRLM